MFPHVTLHYLLFVTLCFTFCYLKLLALPCATFSFIVTLCLAFVTWCYLMLLLTTYSYLNSPFVIFCYLLLLDVSLRCFRHLPYTYILCPAFVTWCYFTLLAIPNATFRFVMLRDVLLLLPDITLCNLSRPFLTTLLHLLWSHVTFHYLVEKKKQPLYNKQHNGPHKEKHRRATWGRRQRKPPVLWGLAEMRGLLIQVEAFQGCFVRSHVVCITLRKTGSLCSSRSI